MFFNNSRQIRFGGVSRGNKGAEADEKEPVCEQFEVE
jgi:hypothetical protein